MSFDTDLFDVFDEVPQTSAPNPVSNLKRTHDESTENENDAPKRQKVEEAPAPAPTPSKNTVAGNWGGFPVSVDIPLGFESAHSLHSSCTHQCSFPPSWTLEAANEEARKISAETLKSPPAKEYKFELDAFQRQSVKALERGDSVLVSAHTSAGKTSVAEYAIAMSLRDNQRVIYTSPIKALSNQKYREFYDEFSDVGLMTGDVSINPQASCLVMTTEILRSMLYRGSEITREVKYVIFDEIHYMRDKERGVVWEETIVLLPDIVRMVFLSATIPNAREFAEWFAALHKQPCHAVYTDYRPTPLQHYIFPCGGDGLHLVVDEHRNFRDANFQRALSALAVIEETKGGGVKGRKQSAQGQASDIYKIVKMIMERNYEPVIVFAFSKKEVETRAIQMAKLDFNNEDEKKLVESVFNNAVESLAEEDKGLPQISALLPLLKRGVGIHHSGLLPILKEVIEILFQEGLIKALFATETFSMGINMPAKTVVFTSVRKFDGEKFRWVSGGEYIQMSGRAGRRGLDDRGIVIMMVDEKMEPEVAKGMVKGEADPLNSTFHLGYGMILNMFRLEEVDPEYMIKRSFAQFQHDRAQPKYEEQLQALQKERDAIVIENERDVAEYYNMKKELDRARKQISQTASQPAYSVPFLQPGRLVEVVDGDTNWGWGVVVNFHKRAEKNAAASIDGTGLVKYVVDVLLNCEAGSGQGKSLPKPCPEGSKGEMMVVPVLLPLISNLSSVRVYVPKDLRPLDKRKSVQKTLEEIQKRFSKGVPLLDPIEDMLIDDEDFKKLIKRTEKLQNQYDSMDFQSVENDLERLVKYHQKVLKGEEIDALKKKASACGQMLMRDDLKAMKRVMRRLDYLTPQNVVTIKGRVACELSVGHELVLTELMFDGAFTDLSPKQICALLSCLATQEETDNPLRLKDELSQPLRQLQDTARRVAKVMQEYMLPVDPDEYVKQFRPELMEVVYAWADGVKFSDICEMTDLFEGSIIRSIRLLDEVMRQMGNAAASVGNTELESKFKEGNELIKRGVVFAASLYL